MFVHKKWMYRHTYVRRDRQTVRGGDTKICCLWPHIKRQSCWPPNSRSKIILSIKQRNRVSFFCSFINLKHKKKKKNPVSHAQAKRCLMPSKSSNDYGRLIDWCFQCYFSYIASTSAGQLFILFWISFYQYFTQYSFQATGCSPKENGQQ